MAALCPSPSLILGSSSIFLGGQGGDGTYPLQGGTQPTLEAATTCCQQFQRVKVLGIPMGEGECDSLPPQLQGESWVGLAVLY